MPDPEATGEPAAADPTASGGRVGRNGRIGRNGRGGGNGRISRVLGAVGNQLLTVAAIGGGLCIAALLAAWWFNISLIMFSTGSMSPTIPAGSVAVVRQIPAAGVAVGDVVTVDRPGRLPVTHRVTAVAPGEGDARLLTLRGDANAVDDPQTYPVTTVRRVMFSIPKLAAVIVAFSDPLVLGGITIAAALLVTWAFWPRGGADQRPGRTSADGDAGDARHAGTGGRTVAGLLIAGVVGLGGALATPPPGAYATAADGDVEVIRSRVLVLTSIGDRDAMTRLQPGRPAHWQVGVAADTAEPGTIALTLSVQGALAQSSPGLHLRVAGCPQRWLHGTCEAGETPLLPAGPAARYAGTAVPLGSMPAAGQRWLQVTAWLGEATTVTPGTSASVLIRADGFGEAVSAGPGAIGPGDLSDTGADVRFPLLVGAAALVVGATLILAVRRRRGGEPV